MTKDNYIKLNNYINYYVKKLYYKIYIYLMIYNNTFCVTLTFVYPRYCHKISNNSKFLTYVFNCQWQNNSCFKLNGRHVRIKRYKKYNMKKSYNDLKLKIPIRLYNALFTRIILINSCNMQLLLIFVDTQLYRFK